MSSSRRPPQRQTSGPRNGPKRSTSETSLAPPPAPAAVFNAKEVFEFLSSRVNAAENAVVYKGEQKAWGAARPFNPVNDNFLDIVQMAVDEFKQSAN